MSSYLKIFFSLLRLVSIPVLNFLTLLLGIHFYGKENWGEFINISIWIYFIAFIAKWSGQNFMIKAFSQKPSNIYAVFYSNCIERSVFLLLFMFMFFAFPFKLCVASFFLLITIFVYNSFDSLIVYHQKFKTQLFAEIIGLSFIYLSFLFYDFYNLETIIYLFCISFLIRILIVTIRFKLPTRNIKLKISLQNIITSFPYFLIGFSGWLASKIDIYIISFYFSKKELSEYQLLIACFIMLQAIPAYIILPINKHLFRMTRTTTKKIKRNLILSAFPIVFLFTVLIWIFLEQFMHQEFSLPMYFFVALSTIPSFIYSIDIVQLFRMNKEKAIMKFSFIAVVVNIILMILLIPTMGLLGVIVTICISQWLYLLLISNAYRKVQPLKLEHVLN